MSIAENWVVIHSFRDGLRYTKSSTRKKTQSHTKSKVRVEELKMSKLNYLLPVLLATFVSTPASYAFTLSISGDDGNPGEMVQNRECAQSGEASFTSDSSGTFYSNQQSTNGTSSIELNIREGHKGFGLLGGVVSFENCSNFGGRRVIKGEQIWVKTKIKFPLGFEFNQNGLNKFMRLRTFHDEEGRNVSEGYNDLYLNADPSFEPWKPYAPYKYIFEGAQQWFSVGVGENFFQMGKWETIEYSIRLDDKVAAEGGNALVRVWLNGRLLGETQNRRTLNTPESWVSSLYFFTYWDNAGAHKNQKFWIDDLVITTDTPTKRDALGNPFIGVDSNDSSAPSHPNQVTVTILPQ